MILVTGATGFIGSHLVEALLARGEKVRALVRQSSSRRHLAAVAVACADLGSGEGLDEALADVDTVIHLGGATKALRAEDYYTANVKATEALARAIAGRGIRMVHVSSLAAIGPSPDGKPIEEDAEPHPLTAYGKSKLEAERVVLGLLPDAVIIRPPVVYGPRDTGVFEVLTPISKGWALEIAGGERWFSAIYVRDLVDGLMAAARCSAAAGRTYFLAHPVPASWSSLTSAAARIMGLRARTLRIPARAAQAVGFCAEVWAQISRKPGILSREKIMEAQCAAWVCDSRRAAAEMGFVARTPLEKGLAETLAWYKEAGWLRY
jgi:nucleoside-diphosphate-sugar epimerase